MFRGLTIAGMLLVNNPGTWGAIYPPLEHAEWHGWTPTDLIFPFFLFIAGVTTHLSLAARRARGDDDGAIRRQIIRRGAADLPARLPGERIPVTSRGATSPESPTRRSCSASSIACYHWRIMGVLQRIGLAYIVRRPAEPRTNGRSSRSRSIAALLFGYWFAMTLLPVPGHRRARQLALGKPAERWPPGRDRLLLDWSRFGLGNHSGSAA